MNTAVNTSVQPVTDLELYGKVEVWTYPTANKGDCEDYVLLKRRMLIERGCPESTLLITVVRDENNEGHAVLDRPHRQGRLRSRQQAPRHRALGRHALHLHQAAVREESAGVDLALAARQRAANRDVSLQQPLEEFSTPKSPSGTLLRPGEHPPPIPDPTGPLLEPASPKRPAPFFRPR